LVGALAVPLFIGTTSAVATGFEHGSISPTCTTSAGSVRFGDAGPDDLGAGRRFENADGLRPRP
jgi:hypothetical protein